ncbi:MAG: AI-2E family transporter [Lachnospiraceae bacterium]|nr:AI-2E family transporter [Lachnospiraceae bacterium]
MSFLKKDESEENRQFSAHVRIVAREALLVSAAIVVLTFIFLKFNEVRSFFTTVSRSLQGIFFGVVIAYLLDPLVKLYRKLFDKLCRKAKHPGRRAKFLSIFMGILTGILGLVLFVSLILPGLVESISFLVGEIPNYLNSIQKYFSNWRLGSGEMASFLSALTEGVMNKLQVILGEKVTEWSGSLMSAVGSGLVDFIKALINLLVGFVIAVYLLRDKNLALSQGKKLIYTVFSEKRADEILDVLRHGHRIFGGFITGKIIDSLIIGLICAVFCLIIGMPYGLLVSVIVGVTNIIPFFGPFIGAIPSALLILMASPVKCLIFVIFIIVLQQIDGNILGPYILGDRINLNEFWVTLAILLFGGIFGIFGMVAGVPIFATAYYVIGRAINLRLEKKGLPTDANRYRHIQDHRDLKDGPEMVPEEEPASAE